MHIERYGLDSFSDSNFHRKGRLQLNRNKGKIQNMQMDKSLSSLFAANFFQVHTFFERRVRSLKDYWNAMLERDFLKLFFHKPM